MNTACLEPLCDTDTPSSRNAASPLAPFQACGGFGTEFRGDRIDDLPSESDIRHDRHFGRFVQIVKDQLPKDSPTSAWHNLSMAEKQSASIYNVDFISRVKALREGMRTPEGNKWTSEQMAKALNIPADRYRKYESRTPLPHELLERFALICGVTVQYLVTGTQPTGNKPAPNKTAGSEPALIATARYKRHAVDSSKEQKKRA